ncbi:MAG: hypothetical protein WD059_13755 [Balneolaceae bacterium]
MASSFLGILTAGIILDGTNIADIPALFIVLGGALVTLPFGQIFLQSYFNKQKSQLKSIVDSVAKKLNPSRKPQIKIEDDDVYKQEISASSTSSSKIKP